MIRHILRSPSRWRLPACAGLIVASWAAGAWAQDGLRVYREQLRVELDQQTPQMREMTFDAGGWFNFAFFKYNDAQSGKWRTLREYDLRGWASMSLGGVHRAYVRGLTRWDDWNSGTNPAGDGDDNDDDDQRLERAWYQFDLGQLIQNQTGQRPPVRFRAKVGREYAEIGSALVLAMPMDLVQVNLDADNWSFMGLLGKTITHTPNIDSSPAIQDHQDRCLWGVQATYRGLEQHQPFAYFLNNQDNTKPWGRHDPDQAFEYSSRYVGAGSTGSLILPDLRYVTEVVGEWGKTYSDGVAAGRDNIEAMALDVLLEYLFRCRTHPKVSVEYLFGSGDADRQSTATGTVGGNRPGTEDHAFNAFGFRDTGIAFSPRASNLHIYSAGASFFPLEHIRLLKKMEVGTKAFWYNKARADGAISDTTATNDARWVGWEWDVYCNWRITSDLTWTVRYGAFRPGEAFENDDCRQFLYTAITYSF